KQQEIMQHTANKPAIADADTVETLSQQNQQLAEQNNAANQNIGQIKTQLENNQKAADKLKQQIAERDKLRAECDLWGKLNSDFGTKDSKKFQRIAQSFLLDQILQTANHYLKEFNPRYLLATQGGSLVILVKDLYEGGHTRPATSLSGGESFMISLSLALGLSTFNTTNNVPDTLFIDEGFGTLDSNYVSSVMDTLERLNQIGGRKVGIISHVEQLRERIAAKIRVERKNNTASTVSVE
ncbi:MAG: exonuclease SbcC, partial [Bacteroidales bacterium]|nr:exonuclease SbcC [Bacteroidales bacterium]